MTLTTTSTEQQDEQQQPSEVAEPGSTGRRRKERPEPRRHPDPAMKVDNDVDAVLAVLVDDLYEQVHDLRMAVGFLMQRTNLRPPTGDDVKRVKRGRPSADQDLWRWLYRRLYSDRPSGPVRAATLPPFPPHWLAEAATRNRSVAQVAGSRQDAADRLANALRPKR